MIVLEVEFKVQRGKLTEGRVQSGAVVENLDEVEDVGLGELPRGLTSSVLRVAKKDSETALSKQFPLPDMLWVIWCLSSSNLKALLAYWLPLSEWNINPEKSALLWFLRRCKAIFRALRVKSSVIRSDIAQPTTLRE